MRRSVLPPDQVIAWILGSCTLPGQRILGGQPRDCGRRAPGQSGILGPTADHERNPTGWRCRLPQRPPHRAGKTEFLGRPDATAIAAGGQG